MRGLSNIMKKKLVTSVLSIALTIGLAGCGANTATKESPTTAPAADSTKENAVTLKLAMWDSDSEFLDSWTKK